MMNILCPMSSSSNLVEVERFKTADLIDIYRKTFNIDVEPEFSGISEITLYHCSDSDLIFFSPAITGSEKFYEMLQSQAHYYADDKEEYQYASQWIKPIDKVLEIGCGKATFLNYIKCEEYRGLEFSLAAVEMAREKSCNVSQDTIQTHCKDYSGHYDVVCAFQVLEHVEPIESFIHSSIECLKPGGLLIYSTPSASSFINKIPNFVLDMPPHHVTRWSDLALTNLSRFYGLEFVEIWHEPLQDYHINLYWETIIRDKAYTILGVPFKRIEGKLMNKIVTFLIRGCVKIFPFKFLKARKTTFGHTVVAVYQKPF